MTPRQNRQRPLYMISVAADLAGVHPQTLRIYEAKGLIRPSRSAGNTRMYSEEDIDRLKLVQQLTAEGINLAGVIRILDLQLQVSKRECEIEALRKRSSRFEALLHEQELRQTITALAKIESSTQLRVWGSNEE